MSAEKIVSAGILIGTALGSYLVVYLVLRKAKTTVATWLLFTVLWVASFLAILLVDVNFPLAQSHYSYVKNDGPAPEWLAVLALAIKFAALAAVVLGQKQLRSVAPIGK